MKPVVVRWGGEISDILQGQCKIKNRGCHASDHIFTEDEERVFEETPDQSCLWRLHYTII